MPFQRAEHAALAGPADALRPPSLGKSPPGSACSAPEAGGLSPAFLPPACPQFPSCPSVCHLSAHPFGCLSTHPPETLTDEAACLVRSPYGRRVVWVDTAWRGRHPGAGGRCVVGP